MKGKPPAILFFIGALFLSLLWLNEAASQEKSGCIKCHTDEGVMKSLFKAPKMEAGEGEG